MLQDYTWNFVWSESREDDKSIHIYPLLLWTCVGNLLNCFWHLLSMKDESKKVCQYKLTYLIHGDATISFWIEPGSNLWSNLTNKGVAHSLNGVGWPWSYLQLSKQFLFRESVRSHDGEVKLAAPQRRIHLKATYHRLAVSTVLPNNQEQYSNFLWCLRLNILFQI